MKAFIFLSALVFVKISYAQQTQNLKAPTPPTYETCRTVENQIAGATYSVQDPACTQRNDATRRQYEVAVTAYNRASQIISTDAARVTEPVLRLETCQTVNTMYGTAQVDYACQSRNQQAQSEYNIQHSAWAQSVNDSNQAQQQALTEQQRRDSESQAKSAAEALELAQRRNREAAAKSNSGANITQALSVGFGVAFGVSCSGAGATCNYGYLASSVAMAITSSQHSKQAGENNNSALSACQTQTKLSGTQINCDQTSAPNLSLVPDVLDANGNCVAKDKSTCAAIISGLPPGVTIKDVAKNAVSGFANLPYKVNPNGTITTKDGKTFKASDLSSLEGLKSAGLTDEQARATLAQLSKLSAGNALDQAKLDLKEGLYKPTDFSGSGISGSGGTEVIKLPNERNTNGAVGSQDIKGLGIDKKRIPAGAGLTRDFNGETIGVATDDIFSMMNRRYKMKTAQDSFIGN